MTRYSTFLVALVLSAWVGTAAAETIRVPQDKPTIEEAVTTAPPGATIEVGPGRWCGAEITQQLHLRGKGDAVIVAGIGGDSGTCGKAGPGGFLVGFHLDAGASGTTISHFTFDGSALASGDVSALGIAVYGVGVHSVEVSHNKVRGTVLAFGNVGGNGWTIEHNDIRGLTTFNGNSGFAILVSQAQGSMQRPTGNVVRHNKVEGIVPASLPSPSTPLGVLFRLPGSYMAGVRVAGTDGTEVAHNQLFLAAQTGGTVRGAGVYVTRGPAGRGGPGGGPIGQVGAGLPSVNTEIAKNEGNLSDYVAVVDANQGAALRHNQGRTMVGGVEDDGKGKVAGR